MEVSYIVYTMYRRVLDQIITNTSDEVQKEYNDAVLCRRIFKQSWNRGTKYEYIPTYKIGDR